MEDDWSTHNRLVICAGLYSSGSTWMFNLVRQVVRSAWPTLKVASGHFDAFAPRDWMPAVRTGYHIAIIKTHTPCEAIVGAAFSGAPVVITVRDPRDAVCSLVERFSYDPEDAIEQVISSALHLTRLSQFGAGLTFKFENHFPTSDATLSLVSSFIGADVDDAVARTILSGLTVEAVHAFIAQATAQGVLKGECPKLEYDPVTQWHPNHVGDRLIGKYKNRLSDAQIRSIQARSEAFMNRFGYI